VPSPSTFTTAGRSISTCSLSPDEDLSATAERLRAALPDLKVVSLTDVSLRILAGGVPVDLVRYPYAPLEPPERGRVSLPVAGLRDDAERETGFPKGLTRKKWEQIKTFFRREAPDLLSP
jgi:hypothetical protein